MHLHSLTNHSLVCKINLRFLSLSVPTGLRHTCAQTCADATKFAFERGKFFPVDNRERYNPIRIIFEIATKMKYLKSWILIPLWFLYLHYTIERYWKPSNRRYTSHFTNHFLREPSHRTTTRWTTLLCSCYSALGLRLCSALAWKPYRKRIQMSIMLCAVSGCY